MTEGLAANSFDVGELAVVFDSAWTLLSAILLVLLQLGFALVEAGTVQERHLLGTLMQHLLMLMVGAVTWIPFGSTIALNKSWVEVNVADTEQANSLLDLVLCLTTVAIALRGVAERAKIWAHVAVAVAVSTVLYPIARRWTSRGGWLQELDPPFHAGAGAAALHLVGGVAAAVGARLAGLRHEAQPPTRRRRGTRPRPGVQEFQAHRVPAVVMGTLVMWIGWYGFGAVCTTGMRTREQALTAARVAVNTTLGALSGGLLAFVSRAVSLRASLRRISPHIRHGEERSDKASSGPALVACCFGAMSGLVAVAGVCDCVENGSALVVGALGSMASLLGARALKALKVDDPMEAGAVHGCAGAVGVISVGLFHRHSGLFASGDWELLGTQFLGVLAIGWFTGFASFLLFRALRCLGVLALQKQKQREELCIEAIQELFAILDRFNLQVEDTIDALTKLQGVICRPFSPQAGTNKIEGEVLDVCNLLSFTLRPSDEYLAFISHYKAESGDAARIIYDHITHAVLGHLGLGSDDSPRPRSPSKLLTRNTGTLDRLRTPTDLEVPGFLAERNKSPPTEQSLCDIDAFSVVTNSARDPRRGTGESRIRPLPSEEELAEPGFGSSVSTSESRNLFADMMSPSIQNFRNFLVGAGATEGPQLDHDRLLFLDSVELRDLDELLNAVRSSSNFVILLTKGVLTRPWVLAELTVAVAEQKNIVAVRIEWPCKDDEKHFTFPDCIEGVVQQLEACKEEAQVRDRVAWAGYPLRRMSEKLTLRKQSSGHSSSKRTPSTSAESSPRRTPSSGWQSKASGRNSSGSSSPSRHPQCDGFRTAPAHSVAHMPKCEESQEPMTPTTPDKPTDIV